ncbi:MAG: hypothetical protein AAGH64_12620, partial [Planctomycetota bacterium]
MRADFPRDAGGITPARKAVVVAHRADITHAETVPSPGRARGGFTLAEAAMASAVLGLIMVAVATSIGTAQQMAFESQKRLLASIAADDLLSEISTLAYDDLPALDGGRDDVGAMRTHDGAPYPDEFWALGRRVEVVSETVEDGASGAIVEGVIVTVSCFDEWTDLASYQLFVADPDPEPVLVDPPTAGATAGTPPEGEASVDP